MRLYFDTNIHSLIYKRGEASVVREFVEQAGHELLASDTNLMEMWRISDPSTRAGEVRNLTQLADRCMHPPVDYLEAQEFVAEVKRCRPEWPVWMPETSRIAVHLNGRRRNWIEAKLDPSYLPRNGAEFARDYESAPAREVHNQVRQLILKADSPEIPRLPGR